MPRCSCGYTAEDADDFRDHLLEVFTRKDAIGADGRAHDEIAAGPPGQRTRTLRCFCSYATREGPEFDDHVLAMFLTPDRIGIDESRHVPVMSAWPRPSTLGSTPMTTNLEWH